MRRRVVAQNKVTSVTHASIEKFLASLCGKGRAENTLRAYRADLTAFLTEMGPRSVPLTKFEETAQAWLNRYRRVVKPKTTARRLTALRTFAKWAGQPDALHEYSAPTPARAMPHPMPEGIDGVLRVLAEARNARESALVALCGLAGLRLAEALDIGPEHLDVPTRMLTVRGKGDKTRVLPLSELAFGTICPAVAECYLTQRPTLVGYRDRRAREILSILGERAHLRRHVSSHDYRATFATESYARTLDLRATQEYLGHSSSKTTETYTGISVDAMRRAAEAVAS
jgi:site-specific recombinase XerD